jgi:integrase
MGQKSLKGSVVVASDRGWLRLRWRYKGKRCSVAVGLPDSPANRVVAQGKARHVELEIALGTYDPTLKRYRNANASNITVRELFQRFMDYKQRSIVARSLDKYESVKAHLEASKLGSSLAATLSVDAAQNFADFLCGGTHSEANRVSIETAKTYCGLLYACWNWAIGEQILEGNPWKDVRSRKVPPKQMPKPFTREEIGAIILGFRTDKYYSHYSDYVEFLFGTGCRTGEAIGLRWKHVNEDCSQVLFCESLSRGIRKGTKTNKNRSVDLTPNLQRMLLARRQDNFNPDALVFPSPTNKAIDDHNFRNRAWVKVLTRLEIDYRKPYNTRHTLVSHALDLGMSPATVASLTGHSVRTLYENYAGNVRSRAKLPEVLG